MPIVLRRCRRWVYTKHDVQASMQQPSSADLEAVGVGEEKLAGLNRTLKGA